MLRHLIFYSSALVAATGLVCCVAFGEVIGIREPYLRTFRWLAAILFNIAVLPVVADLFWEGRKHRFNPLFQQPVLLVAGFAALALFF